MLWLELCRRFHVRQLDLFGSAATGAGFDPARSDLDLLVRFEALLPGDYADAYFGLLEALEKLSGRSVDLVPDSTSSPGNPRGGTEVVQCQSALNPARAAAKR